MPNNYILRNVDPDTWSHAMTRAKEEGLSLRTVIEKCLELYADGRIAIKATRTTPA